MSINNKKSAILFPLIISGILVLGIFIGMKLSSSRISERLLIYPRVDKVNSVLNMIEDSYVDSVPREKLEKVAIESILQKLDPHSIYIPAEELQAVNEPLEGNFSGIGIQYNIQNDTLVVMNTVPNGPSEKVGIKAGDRIVRVNDTTMIGTKLLNDKIISKLKGKKGSAVKISVKRFGNRDLVDFNIIRDIIPLYSIDIHYMINRETGYIKINKFAKNTYDEFLKSAKDLHAKGMKKVIIDLRGNGGGYLESVVKIADEFLDGHKLIVYQKGRAKKQINSESTPGGVCVNDSLAILMDEYSASASEILAGAIQDNDRGWIVGRRSFGKGLVQEQSSLPGGSAIRLTIARYYTPTGRCIQKPYSDNTNNYYQELHNRYLHGEMTLADSTHFNDSLKFKTPGGRVVYGGGGIMPDYFVPLDTSGFSHYFANIRDKSLIYKYAFFYSDTYRAILTKFKTNRDLVSYLKKQDLKEKFIVYASKNGINGKYSDIVLSASLIENELEAYICRNFFDNDGFYPVINSIDKTIIKALEVLRSDKSLARMHHKKATMAKSQNDIGE